MKIFAHRGYSAKYPENTIAAFQAAAQLPIYGVELDVHLTKDNQIVVIHDETIDRTSNGSGFVKDLTLEQLRKFDFGSWLGEEYAGEKIPTLSEVLALFCKTNLMVNIELKSDIFVYAGLEEKVLQEVSTFGMQDQIIISSFDHEAVNRVARLAPNVENAALFANMILNVVDYQKTIPTKALHVALPTAVRKPVLEAIKKNSVVRVYTVNEIDHAEVLLNIGVDAIFTDEPEKMLEFMKLRGR
ncbi:glycerophosphoryl diester phosphodiesterase [Ureibacillus xyleni]|uniref:Glycerophosphoryl diester phosphodiesterase n=1 Tax=Ureibacillus xyleni TaxID=614648 RepID=A0A285SX12_9BACL|nr:glycerophosphodiester phosphodiesterase [Ureibacillus xyleni]SOC11127.1 glycerophosphoryl diester phosphodiesterase [Ureibacillus xyleni]